MMTRTSQSTSLTSISGPFDDRPELLYGPDFAQNGGELTPPELWKLRSAVLQRLRQYPYFALIKGLPGVQNAKDLRRVTQKFGRFAPYFGVWRLLRGKKVREPVAEIKLDPEISTEARIGTNYSRTSDALEPHTDGSYFRIPYDILILHCVESDNAGGDTILVPIDDLAAKIDRDQSKCLRAADFPFGRHLVPIIKNLNGQDSIRYYRTQLMQSIRQKAVELSEASLQALEALNRAINDDSIKIHIKLEPNDMLFVNNRKTMHGRTSVDENSRRLLLRDRVFSNNVN